MRMPSSFSSAGNIVKVINSFYFKWNMPVGFYEGQVTSGIRYFREINNFAEVYIRHL